MAFGDEDLDVFVDDMGVPMVWGSYTGKAIHNAPGSSADFGGVQVMTVEHELIFKASAFPGIDGGAQITVDGVAYQIRDVNAMDDGSFLRGTLKKA